jgi:peptidoglycan hydrolase CwlO-like protein
MGLAMVILLSLVISVNWHQKIIVPTPLATSSLTLPSKPSVVNPQTKEQQDIEKQVKDLSQQLSNSKKTMKDIETKLEALKSESNVVSKISEPVPNAETSPPNILSPRTEKQQADLEKRLKAQKDEIAEERERTKKTLDSTNRSIIALKNYRKQNSNTPDSLDAEITKLQSVYSELQENNKRLAILDQRI